MALMNRPCEMGMKTRTYNSCLARFPALVQGAIAQPGTRTDMARKKRDLAGITRASESDATAVVVDVEEKVELGKSGVYVPRIGIGAWSWGDRSGYWGWKKEDEPENKQALKRAIELGIDFVDTAEVYGFGLSEELCGKFYNDLGVVSPTATKFAPLPWRLTRDAVPAALKQSLERLKLGSVDLYMQHWPGFLFNTLSNDEYLEGLAQCKIEGLCRAVGVSNFNKERIERACNTLGKKGVALASNQVQYSLLYRAPERNGVLKACQDNDVTLVAYSPLCQGLLTGKYRIGKTGVSGVRSSVFTEERLRALEPLLGLMEDIGTAHEATIAQVALNWLLCKGVLPIPGVKTVKHVEEAAGALGWRLTNDEVTALERTVVRIPESLLTPGAPFENW